MQTISPRVQSVVMKPSTAAAVTVDDGSGRQRRHRHRGADPGRPGRGQDRHRADAVRRRDQQRVVHRLRARRRPDGRGRRDAQGRARRRRDVRRAGRQGRDRKPAQHDRPRDDHRRALPGDLAPRLGRHGRRLPRRGPAAGPRGRGQGAAPPLRRRPGVRRALPPRGLERGGAVAPEHRRDLRPRRVERHLLHRDGVRRRPLAEGDRARAGRARPGAARSTSSCRSCARRASRTAAA